MNIRDETRKIKDDLASLRQFRRGCYVCGCKAHRKGMTFHHRNYISGEKTYSDFENAYQYHLYLRPIIIRNPERFLYLCNPHHQALERLKRFNPDKFNRLIRAVRMSR